MKLRDEKTGPVSVGCVLKIGIFLAFVEIVNYLLIVLYLMLWSGNKLDPFSSPDWCLWFASPHKSDEEG